MSESSNERGYRYLFYVAVAVIFAAVMGQMEIIYYVIAAILGAPYLWVQFQKGRAPTPDEKT